MSWFCCQIAKYKSKMGILLLSSCLHVPVPGQEKVMEEVLRCRRGEERPWAAQGGNEAGTSSIISCKMKPRPSPLASTSELWPNKSFLFFPLLLQNLPRESFPFVQHDVSMSHHTFLVEGTRAAKLILFVSYFFYLTLMILVPSNLCTLPISLLDDPS